MNPFGALLFESTLEISTADLSALLQRHWGHRQFRPKQEAVVRSILAGHDVAVIMPTGGGKSLCYQLPALATGGMAVVVSPLIALMQDQAAHMETAGIPAAFLNSTLSWEETLDVRRRAERAQTRLLYLSPERLVRDDTLEWLRHVPFSYFAVDEAHCISEWGHEFRPEYRQLGRLREAFPDKPIAAFTASATRQVRHDIVTQLGLRNPDKIVLSFHRPNLRYAVRQCQPREQPPLLEAALRSYPVGNAIVYAPTIKIVEQTAAWLTGRGIPAIAYHGQMEASARQRNQEIWMSGAKRVLVGTVAFGLGINKADVRTVIHLSLPKSLEQYYQEAGRAGRDGQPADCVLLWQKRDAGLLAHFIEDVEDSAERERAWCRYHTIRRFVESDVCRHRQVCLYFGETPRWTTCGACDVCGVTPEWLNQPVKVAAASPRKRLKKVEPAPPADSGLREKLRAWRKAKASEQSVPAYVILHDKTLDTISGLRPGSLGELLEVPGIGERKADRFGAEILALVQASI
jgi:ATP-dependent DNA helicase RecQ